MAEWIPFGANQIVSLNERLGALDRCQGGFFTSQVDENPTDTKMSVPQGNTNVMILDFDFVRFINFEADINYAEDEGIVQVENFGMHLNVDGTIIYGMKIEASTSTPHTRPPARPPSLLPAPCPPLERCKRKHHTAHHPSSSCLARP